MFGYVVKLEYKNETDKAFQLPSGNWIPKSQVDTTYFPYCDISHWFMLLLKKSSDERDIAKLKELESMHIAEHLLPEDVLERRREERERIDKAKANSDYYRSHAEWANFDGAWGDHIMGILDFH